MQIFCFLLWWNARLLVTLHRNIKLKHLLMMKYLYTFFLVLAMSVMMPQNVFANDPSEPEEEMKQPKVVLIKESTIKVVAAEGLEVRVYDVAGMIVSTVRIDSVEKTVNLGLQKGCYIVKVGKTVRKISVR